MVALLSAPDLVQQAQPENHPGPPPTARRTAPFSSAAIQSAHAHRAATGVIDWPEIALLYEGLVRIAPTIGSRVGRAVALAQAGDPVAGLDALEEIPAGRRTSYQPWWAARGHVLQLLARTDEARDAFRRAAGLTENAALREYLFKRVGL